MLTNEQVIEELMKLADEIKNSNTEGSDLGLTPEEVAFYDALTKPAAIKDFYSNEQLVQLTRELTESLRKNKTIDWQRREGARSSMKMLVKRLLKKYKYPPEGFDDAVQTVLTQCELWTDNTKM
jgi:type I restriction enzyme R subunit